jgi:hypothetical protein
MNRRILFFLFSILLLLSGCGGAININNKVLSLSPGQSAYQDGNLVSNYKADVNSVWAACEKTVAELKAKDIQKERNISTGTIKAIIQEEKVTIYVEYMDRNWTAVSVFVGVAGNNMASKLILDKIADYLRKP